MENNIITIQVLYAYNDELSPTERLKSELNTAVSDNLSIYVLPSVRLDKPSLMPVARFSEISIILIACGLVAAIALSKKFTERIAEHMADDIYEVIKSSLKKSAKYY